MSSWPRRSLADVADSMVDGPFGSALKTEHYVRDPGTRVVRLTNLGEGRYLQTDDAFIEDEYAQALSRHEVVPGDVLVASLGDENHRPGRACLYPPDFAPGIVKADCFRVRPSPVVDPRFLVRTLNSESVIQQGRALAQGVTRDRINLGQLRTVEVPIPPLDEQRRIAEVLDTIDDTIRATERIIEKSTLLRSGLVEELLARADGEKVRLDSVSQILGGKRLPAGHAYSTQPTAMRYLRVIDFFNRPVGYETLASLTEETFGALRRYEIEDGDCYISIAGSIGYVGVNRPPSALRTILTENAARIVCGTAVLPEFLASQMNASAVQRQIQIEIGIGGGVPKLALHRIASLLVRVPRLEDQRRFVDLFTSLERDVMCQREHLRATQAIREGLAADLLSGRVRTTSK